MTFIFETYLGLMMGRKDPRRDRFVERRHLVLAPAGRGNRQD